MASAPGESRLAVLLFTDVVGSTELKSRIGTAVYAPLLGRHNDIFESLCQQFAGAEILKHTGDGYFAAFRTPSDAVRFALSFQMQMRTEPWKPQKLATRVGIHVGEVAAVHMAGKADVIGFAADLAARIMSLAQGGQILLTREAFNDARQFVSEHPSHNGDAKPQIRWVAHGCYLFKGSDEALEVFEVGADELAPLSAPPDTEKARRSVPVDEEPILGWRPAVGLEIPSRPGWVLERKLGEGGFGEVWLLQQRRTKERRVFKFCFDADKLRSFKRELTLFRLLKEVLGDRADIARLYEVQLDEPPFFLESEYTAGGDLTEWTQKIGGAESLPLTTRLELLARVADAVAAAHRVGVLHKDLKPANILVHVEPDGTPTPRLADFGIGSIADRTQLEKHSITMVGFTQLTMLKDLSSGGTRMYAPPEILAGRPFTTQGDIYALGVMLYQLVIGDLGRPLGSGWERGVTDELLRADIADCVDADLNRRMSNATELAQRLRNLDHRHAELKRSQQASLLAARRKRRARLLSATAIAATVLLAIALILFLHERRLYRETDRERAFAEANYRFLHDILDAADPSKRSADVPLAQVLDHVAPSIETKFADQPLVRLELHQLVGHFYRLLRRSKSAQGHLVQALELERQLHGRETLTAASLLIDLGYAVTAVGSPDWRYVASLHEECFRIRRKILGDNDPLTVHAKNCWDGARGEMAPDRSPDVFYENVTKLTRGKKTAAEVKVDIESTVSRTRAFWQRGDPAMADKTVRDLAAVYASYDPNLRDLVPTGIFAIAERQFAARDYDAAEPLARTASELTAEWSQGSDLAGPKMRRLVGVIRRDVRHDLPGAETIFRDAERRAVNACGVEHPDTLLIRTELSETLWMEHRNREALELLQSAINDGATAEDVIVPYAMLQEAHMLNDSSERAKALSVAIAARHRFVELLEGQPQIPTGDFDVFVQELSKESISSTAPASTQASR